MSDLRALLERVEAATGPDLELNGLLAKAFGELPDEARWMVENVYGETANQWVSGGYGRYKFHEPPEYTASIDAALALVEKVLPGWRVEITQSHDGTWWDAMLQRIGADDMDYVDTAKGMPTPPLAILAALLRAQLAVPA